MSTTPAERAELTQLLTDAQAGDNDSAATLLTRFQPAAAAVARSYRYVRFDDAVASANSGIALAIMQARDVDELLRTVTSMARREVVTEHARTPITVPIRTLARYHAIMREAGGDPVTAERIAPERGMRAHTWHAVHRAVTVGDELAMATLQVEADDDAKALVRHVLSQLPEAELRVIRLRYGLEDGRPLSDGDVAERMGTPPSRVTRLHRQALERMRAAIAQ